MGKTSLKTLMTVENICRDSTVGAIGTIGIMETTGNIGTMETQQKISTRTLMEVEKYLYEL